MSPVIWPMDGMRSTRTHAVVAAGAPGGGSVFRVGPAARGVRQSSACCPSQLVHGRIRGRRPGWGPAPALFAEKGINSPHFGFTIAVNNKFLITPNQRLPSLAPLFPANRCRRPWPGARRAPADFFARWAARRRATAAHPRLLFSPVLLYGAPSPARRFPVVCDDPIYRPESRLRPG